EATPACRLVVRRCVEPKTFLEWLLDQHLSELSNAYRRHVRARGDLPSTRCAVSSHIDPERNEARQGRGAAAREGAPSAGVVEDRHDATTRRSGEYFDIGEIVTSRAGRAHHLGRR